MAGTITIDVSKQIDARQGEVNKLKDRNAEIVKKVLAENRDFTPDETKEMEANQAAILRANDTIKTLRSHVDAHEDDKDKDAESRTRPNRDRTERDSDDGDSDDLGDAERQKQERRYARAYGEWLRGGLARCSTQHRELLQSRHQDLPQNDRLVRALSAVGGAAGGFTVPTGFVADIEKGMKDYSGVLKAGPTVMPTETGIDLPWPTINDTSNEGEQGEENNVIPTGEPTFGQTSLKSYLFSSKLILVPRILLDDSGVPIESVITAIIAERLGRITNRRWTTGSGANQPQGVALAAPAGKTAASATAVTYAELVELQASVDPAYWDSARWMFNTSVFTALLKMTDSQGRPIWMPSMNAGMAAGAPGTLMDKPYSINVHMDGMASGKKSILYGNFKKYIIRTVKSMVLVRLEERYAEKLQVGFFAFMRADGRLLDPGTNPIKALVHP